MPRRGEAQGLHAIHERGTKRRPRRADTCDAQGRAEAAGQNAYKVKEICMLKQMQCSWPHSAHVVSEAASGTLLGRHFLTRRTAIILESIWCPIRLLEFFWFFFGACQGVRCVLSFLKALTRGCCQATMTCCPALGACSFWFQNHQKWCIY